jgi:hypothetical protein
MLMSEEAPVFVTFRDPAGSRGELYAHLTEAAFRAAFAQHFNVARTTTLTNGRILFHLEKR